MATITGTSGNDSLTGTSGDDQISGLGGNDTIHMSAGNDTVDGGSGYDTLSYSSFASTGVVVDMGTGTGGSTSFTSIERVIGGAFSDQLTGGAGGENLTGRGGDDILDGRAGNDTLWGEAGADDFLFTAIGAANADSIRDFASGTDDIVLDASVMSALGAEGEFSAGDVRFRSGAGLSSGQDADDRVIYNTTTRQLWYDADGNGTGAAQLIATLQSGATLAATDIVVEGEGTSPAGPTEGDDHLVGTPGDDFIDGLGGDDIIEGLGGDDTLIGGTGWDRLDGGDGNDLLDATAGTAGPNDTVLTGGAGNDTLLGSREDDVLSGGAGNDRLEGGADFGNTVDSLTGGTGQDSFVFRAPPANGSHDMISDFSTAQDKLVFDAEGFTAIGAGGNFAAGDDRFFAGAGANGGQDAEDRVVYNTTTGQVFYDADGSGSGAAQLIATLQAGAMLAATDIIVDGEGTPPPPGPTEGDDHLVGTPGDDTIDGLGGHDLIEGLGGDDTLIGGPGEDRLVGGDGNDFLDGLDDNDPPSQEADVLEGGLGDDTYRVDFTDTIAADPGGLDLVRAWNTSWTLGPGLENLDIIDTQGTALDGIGNDLDNVILSATEGGTLFGMGGNDTLMLRHAQNTARAEGGDGDDILLAGWHSELFGDAGNDLLNPAANAFNQMTGGTGADVFLFDDGVGDEFSTFAEIMDFTTGVDTLRLDASAMSALGASGRFASGDARFAANSSGLAQDASDRIIYNTTTGELWYDADGSGAGARTHLSLLDGAPTLAAADIEVINGTSQEGEHIVGTNGDDTLTDTPGNDLIEALGGNDTIVIAHGGEDTIDGGSGYDSISFYGQASEGVMFDFGNGRTTNVERLLTDSGDDHLIGAAGAQNLSGVAGNDILEGREGNDLLWGGTGNDQFVFRELGTANADGIRDFASGADKVVLDAGIMMALGADGQFTVGDHRFHAAAGATGGADAEDRIIYNTTTRQLFYDADGSGSGAAQLIATLQTGATLVATDVVVQGGSTSPNTITGTEEDDFLVGTDGDDIIDALGGNDEIHPRGGSDTILGGAGMDLIIDNDAGPDDVDGGADMDILMVGLHSAVIVDFGAGTVSGGGAGGAGSTVFRNVEIVSGGEFADEFYAGTGVAIAHGGPGNDLFVGGAGDDVFHDDTTADNADTVGVGNDEVIAGAGDDIISINRGDDVVDAGSGNDTISIDIGFFLSGPNYSYGTDIIDGNDGTDTLQINAVSAVTVDLGAGTMTGGGTGGGGSATLNGIENFEAVDFGGFAHDITGSAGANVLGVRTGDASLNGAGGNDTLTGGEGANRFVFDQAPGAAHADTVTDFEAGRDKLVLDAAVMTALGPSGDFTASDDRFHSAAGATGGGDAEDRIIYNTSTGDVFYDADGNGAAAALLIATLDGAPALVATDIVVVNGSGGSVITGTPGDDTLTGTEGNETIDGLAGDDVIDGVDGSDVLIGGPGNDVLRGGMGENPFEDNGGDTFLGGDGNDVLDGERSRFGEWDASIDTMDGGPGDDLYIIDNPNDVITDAGGIDTIEAHNMSWVLGPDFENLVLKNGELESRVDGIGNELDNVMEGGWTVHLEGRGGNDHLIGSLVHDELFGGDGNDTIEAGHGHDFLDGGAGDDVLIGGIGDDDLEGGAGDDFLRGDMDGDDFSGWDRLSGGEGNDTLQGDSGNDSFAFSAPPGVANADLVLDFAAGEDRIVLDLLAMDALGEQGRFAADDPRFFSGAGASAGQDASDRVIYDTLAGQLWYDADGNGVAEAQLIATFNGAPNISAPDITVVRGSGRQIFGTHGDETIIGTAGDEHIIGLGGNDTIDGVDGSDVLNGGDGDDVLRGGMADPDADVGGDTFFGGQGNDVLDGDRSLFGATDLNVDTMDGGFGDDVYIVDNPGDVLTDPDGIDTVVARNVDWTLADGFENLTMQNEREAVQRGMGNEADNVIRSVNFGWEDHLEGRGGNDTLMSDGRLAVFDGGAGNDLMVGEASITFYRMVNGTSASYGDDIIRAAGVSHVLDFSIDPRSAIDVAMAAGIITGGGTDGSGSVTFERTGFGNYAIDGTPFDDRMVGDREAVAFWGHGGNDLLIGDDGTFVGGINDALHGGDGDDTLVGGNGLDYLEGNAGNDIFWFTMTPGMDHADDVADFASGGDTLRLDGTAHAEVGISGRFAVGDGRFAANSSGTAQDADDRVIYNTSNGDLFYDADGSGAGEAQLIANLRGAPSVAATDIEVINGTTQPGEHIVGTTGNDTLTDTPGNDTIEALGGNDTIVIANGGEDTIDGGDGYDSISFYGQAPEGMVFDFGNGRTTNVERLLADSGDDHLIGAAGSQNLSGVAGNDTLEGGAGTDLLWGGTGEDTFVFREFGPANADTIRDWGSGDSIALDNEVMVALGADGDFASGDARFVANASGTAQDGSDRVVYNTSSGQLYYDADGNGAGAAQLIATISGAPGLAASDISVV